MGFRAQRRRKVYFPISGRCRCVYHQYLYGDKYGRPEIQTDAAQGKKDESGSIVVACGCYVQARKDDIPDGIDIVIGNNKKQNIVEILENYEKEKNPDAQPEHRQNRKKRQRPIRRFWISITKKRMKICI